MADWVHCNLCFVQPGKATPFHITSCGHIYCDKCVIKGSKESCKMCASKNSSMELSGNMKPDVEMYFLDPAEQICKAVKKFMQAYEFQRNHRRRLYTHLLATVEEQKKVLQEAKRMLMSAQSMEKEFIKLKEENIYLKKLVQDKGLGSGLRPSPRSGFSPNVFRHSPTGVPSSKHSSHSSTRLGPASYGSSHDINSSSSQMPSSSQMSQSSMMPDRIIARTPPFNGRMGIVGSAHRMIHHTDTPQSVPHHIYTPSLPGT